MLRATIAVAMLAALGIPAEGSAQQWPVSSGDRIRVAPRGGAPVVGIVRTSGQDGISFIDTGGDSVFFSRTEIRSVEASRGWRRDGGRGAAVGGGLGLGLGILLGALPRSDPGPDTGFDDMEAVGRLVTWGAAGGAVGALAGFILGSRSQSERWQAVEADRPVVAFGPRGVEVRVAF